MSQTSTPDAQVAPVRRWTVRLALSESRRLPRTLGLVIGTVALLCSLDARVPLASGVALAALVPAVLVDVIERRLPNRLVAIAAGLGTIAAVLAVALSHAPISATEGAIGACAMAAPLVVAHLVSPSSLGLGDVKTALVLGAALGFVQPSLGLLALAIGSAGTALVGLVRRDHTVAFGPGLLGGAVGALVLTVSNVVVLG